ncbi:hypothetical protein NQZ79_g1985 [Umbelopsis isabellina]|nr:hypothetical protein NQZ79_g1985 [Umbelopsis isabellina]
MSHTDTSSPTHSRSHSQGASMTSRLTRTFSGQRRPRRNQDMPSISTAALAMGAEASPTSAPPVTNPYNAATTDEDNKPPHVRIVPSLDSPGQSLIFSVIEMDLENGVVVKIGRFTDRRNIANRVTFRSKVVSRAHAEMWSEGRKIFLRDTKSSSGTFLNNIRLSPPSQPSKPVELKDGDIVQLGVDYQGGAEEIYRSVKMKFEVNRTWQHKANPFSVNALNNLRSLGGTPSTATKPSTAASPLLSQDTADSSSTSPPAQSKPAAPAQVEIEECCICLFAIAPFQALFLAPCSHTYHYKCIRPLLMQNHPAFSCPICRTYADLEANVAVEAEEVLEMYGLGQHSETPAMAAMTNVRPPSLRAMASTTSLTRYGVRQSSMSESDSHPYNTDHDSNSPEFSTRASYTTSQIIPSALSTIANRDGMANTLVERSQYGMSERLRADADSALLEEENLPPDDERRQTIIQRDDEDIEDVLGFQSDGGSSVRARGLPIPNASTSSPSSAPVSPLSASTSRFLQRRPSASGLVGKLKNVILDKRRFSNTMDQSDDLDLSNNSSQSFKRDELHPNDTMNGSTSFPNLAINQVSSSRNTSSLSDPGQSDSR